MRNNLVIVAKVRDSAEAHVAHSASVSVAQAAEPEFRTPQNAGYMQIAYTVAAVIYASYILVLRRRWSALKNRQNAARARR